MLEIEALPNKAVFEVGSTCRKINQCPCCRQFLSFLPALLNYVRYASTIYCLTSSYGQILKNDLVFFIYYFYDNLHIYCLRLSIFLKINLFLSI
jgi:hypothetical protein